MILKRVAIANLLVAASMPAIAAPESTKPMNPPGTVCWPLHFAGITLDVTNDAQVRRLLGDGAVRQSEGDTGGRYFLDMKHRATLHVVTYTDSIVGELTLTDGIDPALKKVEQGRAKSKLFHSDEGFGNWHALHLGSSKADVLKNLGEPAKKGNEDVWEYATSCACEIPQTFTVRFKDGRVFQIVFSAPAG